MVKPQIKEGTNPQFQTIKLVNKTSAAFTVMLLADNYDLMGGWPVELGGTITFDLSQFAEYIGQGQLVSAYITTTNGACSATIEPDSWVCYTNNGQTATFVVTDGPPQPLLTMQ